MTAWGAAGSGAGVDEWVEQLQSNDPKLTSITIFRTRKFGHKVCSYVKSVAAHDISWLPRSSVHTLNRKCMVWVYMPTR